VFPGPLGASILGRAQAQGQLTIDVNDIRDYTSDRHRVADDEPYGGGAGMVMKAEPVFRAAEAASCEPGSGCRERVVLLCPQGRPLNHEVARELAGDDHLILICGHYEGIDERVREHLVADEISIGDYVLTGGELAALVVIDAVARWVPGVLGAEESAENDSFASGLLEYPQYTRPADFRGWQVPETLLSGHHEQIRRWRRKEALRRSLRRRPELLARAALNEEDRRLLDEIADEDDRAQSDQTRGDNAAGR
jgi:tRNA (guanine37-N1)-methyltransferase